MLHRFAGRLASTRRRRVALTAVLLAGIGVAAYAQWLSPGQGPGRARAGRPQTMTVTAGVPDGSSDCLPGGTCAGFLHILPQKSDMILLSAALGGDPTQDFSGDPGRCPASNLSVNTLSNLSIQVPYNAGLGWDVVVPDLFTLDANAPDGCQGVTLGRSIAVQAQTALTPF